MNGDKEMQCQISVASDLQEHLGIDIPGAKC